MITVMHEESRDFTVVGKVALPRPGDQELPPAGSIFLEQQYLPVITGRLDGAEEPGRTASDNHDSLVLHGRRWDGERDRSNDRE